MNLKIIWNLNYKKVLLFYVLLSLIASIIEFILTGTFQYSFIATYLAAFFIAPYLRKAINEFFKQFHTKKVVRNLITPWIFFGIIYLYVQLFFLLYYLEYKDFNGFGQSTVFIVFFGVIILTLISINHIIRIIAVSFHRRKSTLFPINRIEYAALKYLSQEGEMNFTALRDKIRGLINVFIPEVYFDKEVAAASIYQLCGIRLADIDENFIVTLTTQGKSQYELWQDTLNLQIKRYTKVLNSKGVLVRSFIGLFILSILKITIGNFSSESLRAEGIENFLDCVAVLLIGIGIRFKKEKLVNICLIILMSFAGITILYESIISLIIGPEPIQVPQIVIMIAVISIFLNTYLRVLKNFVGKKNRNSSLVASAIDSRVNILISIGIISGALLSEFGRSQGIPLFYYFDPIIAIIVSAFIFKEIIEIFLEFVKKTGEALEFEKFQMAYEDNFKEYIIKWILLVYNDNSANLFTLEELNERFKSSLKESEEVYTNFSYFGLYLFKDHGIDSVVKNLINDGILREDDEKLIKITNKGKYIYKNFYSKPILEDIKDPFDFFFEQSYDFDSLKYRKAEILEEYYNK